VRGERRGRGTSKGAREEREGRGEKEEGERGEEGEGEREGREERREREAKRVVDRRDRYSLSFAHRIPRSTSCGPRRGKRSFKLIGQVNSATSFMPGPRRRI